MKAKRYLQQLINLDMYIRAKDEDYQRTLARATQATQRLDAIRVQTSSDPHKKEDLSAKCTQISLDIDKATDALLDLQKEARRLIEQLEDNRYKAVLTLRYINGRSWLYIAEQMHYTYNHVHKIHGQALLVANQKWIDMDRV